MKRLSTYLKDNESSLISLNERLVVNKNYKQVYTCAPKSWKELREIIDDRYNKLGAGTEENPINFNDIDVSNINDNLSRLFYATIFKYINISDWKFSKVKNISYMFFYCAHLKSVGDLSDWDVSNVKYMNAMFYGCEELQSVGNLSNWDVSKVESMHEMFDKSGITNIPSWYKE